MSKITYLIGAGASFGKRKMIDYVNLGKTEVILEGLPIVSEFSNQINLLMRSILPSDYPITLQENIQFLLSELEWLRANSEKHQTVDTFAKKLYASGKADKYARLKSVLSVFLTMIQLNYKPDSRYDAFWAAILGNYITELPDISIFSWNYDCQFEIAFSEYWENNGIEDIWDFLNITNKTTNHKGKRISFSITKLNGTALIYDKYDEINPRLFDPYHDRQGINKIDSIVTFYLKNNNNVKSALSFAWENASPEFWNGIKEKSEDTEILVIIGYSFPYFNREVDRRIIRNMANLKKVYIQDPDCKGVKESFEAVLSTEQLKSDIEFVFKTGTKQFVIPNEM